MRFFGKGVVWDSEKNKRLCKFLNGSFKTEDERIIKKLIDLGYEYEGLIELPVDLEALSIDELKNKADELKITYPHNIGRDKLIRKIKEVPV
jgi:hypothetical protein